VLLSSCSGGTTASFALPPISSTLDPNYAATLRSVRRFPRTDLTVTTTGTTEQRRSVARALGFWETATEGKIRPRLLESSTAASDITIVFVPASSLTAGSAGETRVDFLPGSSTLTRAESRIQNDLDADYSTLYIAHEVGHALGLGGHSPDENDLMAPTPPRRFSVSERDRNTLLTAYR
jgi:hypothetical protein